MIKSTNSEVLSFTMFETHMGPTTQLGTPIGNHHSFCFGPSAKTSQYRSLPNKHPELAAMSKCG